MGFRHQPRRGSRRDLSHTGDPRIATHKHTTTPPRVQTSLVDAMVRATSQHTEGGARRLANDRSNTHKRKHTHQPQLSWCCVSATNNPTAHTSRLVALLTKQSEGKVKQLYDVRNKTSHDLFLP